MTEIEYTDRYEALGIPYPDVETMCKGQCEGTGFVPVHKDVLGEPEDTAKMTRVYQEKEPWRTLWLEAEEEAPSKDGWHFVTCPDCNGTGKATTPGEIEEG